MVRFVDLDGDDLAGVHRLTWVSWMVCSDKRLDHACLAPSFGAELLSPAGDLYGLFVFERGVPL
jgi:hypothetical protein